jgi:hypothetical protein
MQLLADETDISPAPMPESMAEAAGLDAEETVGGTALSLSQGGAQAQQDQAGAFGLGEDGLEDILSLAELILPLAE